MNALTPAFVAQASTALTSPVAAFQPGPDAELIQACADFNVLERRYIKVANWGAKDAVRDDETDAATREIVEAQRPLLDRICTLRPTTRDGCAAIARSLALWDRELFKSAGPGYDANERLLAALVAGLIWKRPPPPAPDAGLLALCAAFIECDRQQRAVHDSPDRTMGDEEASLHTAPIFDRMDLLLTQMEATPARTAAGVAAKAAALAQHSGGFEFSFDQPSDMPHRLLATVMRDAAALGVGTTAPLPPADFELSRMSEEAAELTEEYARNRGAFLALPAGHPDLDRVADLNDAPSDRLDAMFEQAGELKATTLAGARAKAFLLRHEMSQMHRVNENEDFDCPGAKFAHDFACELIQMTEGAP